MKIASSRAAFSERSAEGEELPSIGDLPIHPTSEPRAKRLAASMPPERHSHVRERAPTPFPLLRDETLEKLQRSVYDNRLIPRMFSKTNWEILHRHYAHANSLEELLRIAITIRATLARYQTDEVGRGASLQNPGQRARAERRVQRVSRTLKAIDAIRQRLASEQKLVTTHTRPRSSSHTP